MRKPTSVGYYSGEGDKRRDATLESIEDQGPDNCYGCGAPNGTPHSPLCYVLKRGEVAWAKTEESKSDMIEHRMTSTKGQRGWRKADD